jgi:GNAT superfamily N-acetyltransferase
MNNKQIIIEEWTADHTNWLELKKVIDDLAQTEWVAFQADWHLSSHMLVATQPQTVVGYLRYVVQPIGVEEDEPAVVFDGQPLLEGKVIAFGVRVENRRRGIGRQLQTRLIDDCKAKGCFQIRSHSGAENIENHALKLSLGYAMHPLVRERGKSGAYFLLPLRGPKSKL